jgi:diguanylate cyclase (GGDEF)-like protein/PAS domain S-box-containing protein
MGKIPLSRGRISYAPVMDSIFGVRIQIQVGSLPSPGSIPPGHLPQEYGNRRHTESAEQVKVSNFVKCIFFVILRVKLLHLQETLASACMESKSKCRLSEELESIRQHLAELQTLVIDPESSLIPGSRQALPGVQSDQSEKTVPAADDRYRELFESAGDMIFTYDLTGRITGFNRAAERITGYTPQEASRMTISELTGPDLLATARKQADRQLAGEVPEPYEVVTSTKAGNRLALEVNSTLVFRYGRPAEFQAVARNVTSRKQSELALQEANEKLEAWVNELEHRAREMSLLSELADMLRACHTTDEAYSVIMRIAQQIFPTFSGALYVITSSRNLVQTAAAWGKAPFVERTFVPDECWALRRGRLHWVEDIRSGLLCKHLQTPPPSAYLCVPMMAQSEALGFLHLAEAEGGRIADAQQRLAIAMAEHIAMALSNLRLHETLRSQSIRDPMTGLFNRRFMEESLELELRRATRGQSTLGIIMVDLDRFRDFNQTHGREAGDSALREIGTLLQANVRKEDIACRFSGQRFAVILPQSALEVTHQRAAMLLELGRKLEVKLRNQAIGKIQLSLGVSVFPQHGRTVDSILRAAEAALQRAQEAGGDQVVTAQ